MKTKILFTIGPASFKESVFGKIAARAGGVRINTAHGTVREHENLIGLIRKRCNLPIVLDIKGPEIRVNLEKPMHIVEGREFELYFSGKNCFTYDFSKEAKRGEVVLFDDGKLEAQIISISTQKAVMKAENSHLLKNSKNVHIRGSDFRIPSLSKKDLEEIALANRKRVEYVALSFARTRDDVVNLRRKLSPDISIIAKIENENGLRNIDEIIECADGVMVARGDLALDIRQEKVPLAQKEIIRKCNLAGKLCITATQVLETMVESPHPTRAEVSDIANAVLDGSDAIMLSGETAIGKYPLKAFETICSVANEVEWKASCNVPMHHYTDISDAISKSIYTIANVMPLDAIVSITRSGYTAMVISRFRMKNKVIAVTPNEMVEKQLRLYFGIVPVRIPAIPRSGMIQSVGKFLYSKKLVSKDSRILFTAGVRTKQKHASNLIEVHTLSELLGI